MERPEAFGLRLGAWGLRLVELPRFSGHLIIDRSSSS
jgi:hypothetical protein